MFHDPDDDPTNIQLLRSINQNLRDIKNAIGWLIFVTIMGFAILFSGLDITFWDLF